MSIEKADSKANASKTERSGRIQEIQDIDEEIRERFIELPSEVGGGFVLREDLANVALWREKADRANEGRSLFKKVFLMSRVEEYELMRQNAITYLDTHRTEKEQRKEALISAERIVYESLDLLLSTNEEFRKLLTTHHIDSILIEDASGRFPALIVRKFLNLVYERAELPLVTAYSAPTGRHGPRGQLEASINRLAQRKLLGENILLVTDYISSGGTSTAVYRSVLKARNRKEDPINLFAVVTMGGRKYGGLNAYFEEDLEKSMMSMSNAEEAGDYIMYAAEHYKNNVNNAPVFHGVGRDDGVLQRNVVRGVERNKDKSPYTLDSGPDPDTVMRAELTKEEWLLRQGHINHCAESLAAKYADDLAIQIRTATNVLPQGASQTQESRGI